MKPDGDPIIDYESSGKKVPDYGVVVLKRVLPILALIILFWFIWPWLVRLIFGHVK